MIDLHAHVLPGVDDGPSNEEQARELLVRLREDGVTDVVSTPHFLPDLYEPTSSEIETALERMQSEVSEVILHPGREIRLSGPEVVGRILDGSFSTLAGSGRYSLIELPFQGIPVGALEALKRLHEGGIKPILAHPERNETLARSPDQCEEFIEAGLLLQVNAGSILGRDGPAVRDASRYLFERQWVSFVANDAHDTRRRSPCLTEALDVLESDWDVQNVKRFVEDNPRAVLEGRELSSEVSPASS